MNYRAVVDHYKNQQIEGAQRERIRLRDSHLWESMRRSGFDISIRSRINEAINEAIDVVDGELKEIVTVMRADVLGITSASSMSMVTPIDAVDAGPEHRLRDVFERVDHPDDVRVAVRLSVLNTLYKALKWQSASQLTALLDTLEHCDARYMPEIQDELSLLQANCAAYQAYIEIDLDTKPNLDHEGSSLNRLRQQLMRLEDMNLPFVINGEGE